MQVELRKLLPSHVESVRTLKVEKVSGAFHLIEESGSGGKVLAIGSRADVMACLESRVRRLMGRGYEVSGGDAAFRRLHPGLFQVKLSPEVKEGLDQAGMGELGTAPLAGKQKPLSVHTMPRSRMEAIRLGEED